MRPPTRAAPSRKGTRRSTPATSDSPIQNGKPIAFVPISISRSRRHAAMEPTRPTSFSIRRVDRPAPPQRCNRARRRRGNPIPSTRPPQRAHASLRPFHIPLFTFHTAHAIRLHSCRLTHSCPQQSHQTQHPSLFSSQSQSSNMHAPHRHPHRRLSTHQITATHHCSTQTCTRPAA